MQGSPHAFTIAAQNRQEIAANNLMLQRQQHEVLNQGSKFLRSTKSFRAKTPIFLSETACFPPAAHVLTKSVKMSKFDLLSQQHREEWWRNFNDNTCTYWVPHRRCGSTTALSFANICVFQRFKV